MTQNTDLHVPISQLKFKGASQALAIAESADVIQIGALLQHVIRSHAASELDDGHPLTVSVTFDVSEPAEQGEEITFQSRIDRRTRTLIFASGTATQGARHLLKATVVFRIG